MSSADRAISTLGRAVDEGLVRVGEVATLIGRASAHLARGRRRLRHIVYQVLQVGVRSLPLTLVMSGFAGMVLAFQFGYGLQRFGARLYIGQVTVTAIFRELGPILAALVVGGRIGAGIAAELGGMAVTEQVDAVRALGADPVKKLVVPRVLACILVMPALTVVADVCGLVAGSAVVKLQYDIAFEQFYQSVIETAKVGDFTSGVFKAAVFGLIIAVVGCARGLTVEGGTEGVGRATTQTVAIASVAVCLADFFITKISLSL
jgi:phospholipid/cholesterol/gamma-HCH transport system permease protein